MTSPHVHLTPEQFDAIASLIGAHRPGGGRRPMAAEAARLVLVDGRPAREVRLQLGITDQAMSNALRRYRAAHALILSAYAGVQRGQSERKKNAPHRPSRAGQGG